MLGLGTAGCPRKGGDSPRVRSLAETLARAGFDVEVSACIQRDVWYKLWGNMTMNPVSALTGATVDRVLDDPLVNGFCLEVMREAAAIGARIGCPIEQSGEDRNAVTRKLGAFKTSMLQDVEAGRSLETEALIGSILEMAKLTSTPAPAIEAVYALVKLLNKVMLLEGGGVKVEKASKAA